MSEIHKDSETKIALADVRLLIHQLAAPLSAIQGHISNVIQNRIPEHKIKDRLKAIDAMIQNMKRQLIGFQLLSDIDNSNVRADFSQKENIDRFIRNKILDFQAYAYYEGINLVLHSELDKTSEDTLFQTDFTLLSQVIDELIDNAIRHSYSKYDLESHANINRDILIYYNIKGDLLTLEVTNWGHRIKPEELKSIFSRSFRGNEASKASVGSGTGLYVSKACIEALNGKISVNVDNDKVSFRIELKNHLL